MPGAIRRWEMEELMMILLVFLMLSMMMFMTMILGVILVMFLKLTLPLKVCEEVLRLTAAGGPKGNC